MDRVDPVRLNLFWVRVVSIADEMATALRRSSFSSVVRENLDYSTAIFGADGAMLAQATHVATGHTGSMMELVRHAVRAVPDLAPGDVLATNDPWLGCGHTPDLYLIAPVHQDNRLIGYVSSSANHVDIGGRAGSTESREVYEEGLILPLVRLVREGQENAEILAILRQNVRMPEVVLGDVHAQLAALEVGARRLHELTDEFGVDGIIELAAQVGDHSDRTMRHAISKLPSGVYRSSLHPEVAGSDGASVLLQAKLTIGQAAIQVDYAGTSREIDRPFNCVLNYTKAYTYFALKLLLCPELPNNEGIYRGVTIDAPEGSILNTRFPQPVMYRHAIGLMLPDLLFGALADVLPDRVLAGSGASPIWLYAVSGRRKDGTTFILHSHAMGGLGARPDRDGLSSVTYPPNVYSLPSEILEQENPLICRRRSLRPGSGGVGTFRGGLGEVVELEAPADGDIDWSFGVRLAMSWGWTREGPPGRFGGAPGQPGRIRINGRPVESAASHDFDLRPGDVVRLETPGGGGYGPPASRRQELIERDYLQGLILESKDPS